MNNYLKRGDDVSLIAPYAVASGGGMLVGALFAVAAITAASGNSVEGKTTGCFGLTKTTGEAWTLGVKVYWDDTNKRCTTTAASNTLIGCAIAPAASADIVGSVRLNGIVV